MIYTSLFYAGTPKNLNCWINTAKQFLGAPDIVSKSTVKLNCCILMLRHYQLTSYTSRTRLMIMKKNTDFHNQYDILLSGSHLKTTSFRAKDDSDVFCRPVNRRWQYLLKICREDGILGSTKCHLLYIFSIN